jgi:hypothetical protein
MANPGLSPEQRSSPEEEEQQEPRLEELNVLSPSGELAIAQINSEIETANEASDGELVFALGLEKRLIQHADVFGIIIGIDGVELDREVRQFAGSDKPNPSRVTSLADGVRRRAERASQARWEILGIDRNDVDKSLDLEEALAGASQDLADAIQSGPDAPGSEILLEAAMRKTEKANEIVARYWQYRFDSNLEQAQEDEELNIGSPNEQLAIAALSRLIAESSGEEKTALEEQLMRITEPVEKNSDSAEQTKDGLPVIEAREHESTSELEARVAEKVELAKHFANVERWHIAGVDPTTIDSSLRDQIERVWGKVATSRARAARNRVQAEKNDAAANYWKGVAGTLSDNL